MDFVTWNTHGRKGAGMKKQKGSFTIEAIIWVPIMLCLMLSSIKQGILFYEESIKSEGLQDLQTWDVVSKFYETWNLKELGEEENDQ
mgnify:CR=1 FL=1